MVDDAELAFRVARRDQLVDDLREIARATGVHDEPDQGGRERVHAVAEEIERIHRWDILEIDGKEQWGTIVKEDDQFVGGTYGNNSSDSAAYMIGATAPLGSGLVRFSYQDRNDKSATDLDRRVIALGYTYNLSARTAFYSWVSDSTIKSGGATRRAGRQV